MTFQFTVGPWIIPLVLTIALLSWAIPLRADERDQGGYFGPLAALSAVFRTGLVIIISLVMWLIWAIAR